MRHNSIASGDNSIASSHNSIASGDNSIASSRNSIASSHNSIASSHNSIASIPFSSLYKGFQRQVFYIQFEKADFFFNLASGQLHSV
ncbi:MAG: hypothetical protein RMY36_019830 [Nostoc sp. SerVER01]